MMKEQSRRSERNPPEALQVFSYGSLRAGKGLGMTSTPPSGTLCFQSPRTGDREQGRRNKRNSSISGLYIMWRSCPLKGKLGEERC